MSLIEIVIVHSLLQFLIVIEITDSQSVCLFEIEIVLLFDLLHYQIRINLHRRFPIINENNASIPFKNKKINQ